MLDINFLNICIFLIDEYWWNAKVNTDERQSQNMLLLRYCNISNVWMASSLGDDDSFNVENWKENHCSLCWVVIWWKQKASQRISILFIATLGPQIYKPSDYCLHSYLSKWIKVNWRICMRKDVLSVFLIFYRKKRKLEQQISPPYCPLSQWR